MMCTKIVHVSHQKKKKKKSAFVIMFHIDHNFPKQALPNE